MCELGIPINFSNKIIRLYQNRKIFLKVNNEILGPRLTSLGLPQGSILSPLLYIIYTADIENSIKNGKILQFADDICIYVTTSNSNLQEGITALSNTFGNLNTYINQLRLTISHTKSKVCTLTRKRKKTFRT